MMSEIKPKIVEGEPVCDGGCPKYMDPGAHYTCTGTGHGSPCLLGLRQQRDQSRAPAVKRRDGEPPEGVEVLFETRTGKRYTGFYSAYKAFGPCMVCDDEVICHPSDVTRYIPLAELLPKE
jgi:hypothetical protein